jgi:hypothetical protein
MGDAPKTIPYPVNAIPNWISEYNNLTAKLDWEDFEPYYGAAILYKVTDHKIYFVTNAHVIPNRIRQIKKLFLSTSLNQFNPMKIELVGVAPGYDIALITVEWPPNSQLNRPSVQKWLRQIQYRSLRPSKPVHVAISGVPNFNAIMGTFVKNATWKDEAKLFAYWDKTPPLFFQFNDNYEPIDVKATGICPVTFLEVCYRIPVRTWGFSGGALLANGSSNKDPKETTIIGMVSHYSPLTEWTFVIPWTQVTEVVNALELGYAKQQKTYLMLHDLAHEFEYINASTIKVIDKTSPFFDKTITAEKLSSGFAKVGGGDFSGGGGDFSGGGGDFSGGGGDFSGGGGDFSGGGGNSATAKGASYYLIEDRASNLSGLAKYSQILEESRQPEAWGMPNNVLGKLISASPNFKGGSSLFTYHPGIRIDGVRYIRFGNSDLFNLQDFVRQHKINKRARLDTTLKPHKLPTYFEIPSGRSGAEQYNFIQKLKAGVDVSTLSDNLPFAKKGYPLLTPMEGTLLLKHSFYQGKFNSNALDIISFRNRLFTQSSFNQGEAFFEAGAFNIRFLSGRVGQVDITMAENWTQEGDKFFRYVGPVTLTTRVQSVVVETRVFAAAVAILQWAEEDSNYEFKMILSSHIDDQTKLALIPEIASQLFSPEAIIVQSIYLPLRAVPLKKDVQLSKEHLKVIEERTAINLKTLDAWKKDGVHPEFELYKSFPAELAFRQEKINFDDEKQQKLLAQTMIYLNQVLERIDEHFNILQSDQEKATWAKIVELDKVMREREAAVGIKEMPLFKMPLEVAVSYIEKRETEVTRKTIELLEKRIMEQEALFDIKEPKITETDLKKVSEILKRRTDRISHYIEKLTAETSRWPANLTPEQKTAELKKALEKIKKEEK